MALNSQWFLHFAESKLTESLGQQVNIGALEVDVGRIARLRVEKLWVANPSWAADPYLASVDVLEAGIDLMKLLRGDLLITDLQATAPVVHLELSGQGKGNWAQTNEGDSSPDNHQTGRQQDNATFDLPRVKSMTVKGGRMTYLDPRKDIFLALSFYAGSKGGGRVPIGLMANGGGHLAGEPVTVELSAKPASQATVTRDNPIQLALLINAVQTRLQVEGKIDALLSPERAELKIRVGGKDLFRWNDIIDTALPEFPTYQLAGHVMLADQVWTVNDLKAMVRDSDVTGTLKIIPEANPVRIEGHLSSTRLDVAQLQEYVPQQSNPEPLAVKVGNILNSIHQGAWQTSLTYRADLIETGTVPVHNADIAMRLEEQRLIIEPLSAEVAGIQLTAETQISVEGNLAKGRVHLQAENKEAPNMTKIANASTSPTNATQGLPGNLEMNLAMNIQTVPPSDQKKGFPVESNSHEPIHSVELSTLDIENFDMRYTNPSTNTHIRTHLDENISDGLVLKGKGILRDEPFTLTVSGPTIETALEPSPDPATGTPLSAELQLLDTTASLSAMVEPAWPPMWMNLSAAFHSDAPSAFASLFDMKIPSLGPVEIKGNLSKRSQTWKLENVSGVIGHSDFAAKATVDTSETTRFTATVHSETLDLVSLVPTSGKGESSTPQPGTHETAGIQAPDWLTHLEGILEISVGNLVVPNVTLEDVSMVTKIEDGLVHISPLTVEIGEGSIMTSALLDLRDPSLPSRLQTDIERVDLDKAMQSLGKESGSLGTVSGRLALSLPSAEPNVNNPLEVEALLDRLRIDEVRIRYDDPDLQAKSDLQVRAESVASGIQVNGTVEYHEHPVDVRLSTGSIQKVWSDYQSMPVEAIVSVNDTTIRLDATIGNVFPLSAFKGRVWVEGPDPARLGEALGIPLPHLPPYKLEALVHRKQGPEDQQTVSLQNLSGAVGDSDVTGILHVMTGGERPMISARLHSRNLDFDDLAGLIGAPPDPEETASEAQEARAEKTEDRQTVLPVKPMDFTQLRKLDAEVEYTATDVLAPDLPLNDFALNVTLEDGHLQMDRLDFGVATGTVSMQLEMNARKDPIQAKLHTDVDHVNLSRLLARFDVADDSFGDIGGRAKLWMQGQSLADWFGSADGGLFLTMTGGNIDALLVELAGLDFTESAAIFLSTDTRVKIECGYTDLQARSGIMTIHPFLLDTKDTKFKGYGSIDLRQEKLDLTVEPYPQDFTILSSRGPLHVTGTFSDPEFSVEPTFPSPEFGMADDSARCTGMVDALRNARKEQLANNK
ncbi:AsmA family protein [Nitrospira sp.]